jgi:hypothetical protein
MTLVFITTGSYCSFYHFSGACQLNYAFLKWLPRLSGPSWISEIGQSYGSLTTDRTITLLRNLSIHYYRLFVMATRILMIVYSFPPLSCFFEKMSPIHPFFKLNCFTDYHVCFGCDYNNFSGCYYSGF